MSPPLTNLPLKKNEEWSQIWSCNSNNTVMDATIKPKKENPLQKSNIFGKLLFFTLIPTIWRGYKHGLTPKDLTKTVEEDKAKALGDLLER